MKLYYSHNLNPRVAVAVARYLGSPVEFVRASPTAPDQREAFQRINPNNRVPVLVEETRTLWETDAIAYRLSTLAKSDFWRAGDEMADMIKWLSWSAYHLNPAAGTLYFEHVVRPTFSDEPVSAVQLEEAMHDFRHYTAILDRHLDGRTWLLGEQISYADFRAASALPFAGRAGLPLQDYANVQKWHDRLWAIEAWRDPFGGLTAH